MAEADDDNTVRCWICLDDESLDDGDAGMIAPCACVGTNQWVHEACACRSSRNCFFPALTRSGVLTQA